MDEGTNMSDIMIDIVNFLIAIGRLPADVPMDTAQDYVLELPEEDQTYLLEMVLNTK